MKNVNVKISYSDKKIDDRLYTLLTKIIIEDMKNNQQKKDGDKKNEEECSSI